MPASYDLVTIVIYCFAARGLNARRPRSVLATK